MVRHLVSAESKRAKQIAVFLPQCKKVQLNSMLKECFTTLGL